MTLANNYLTIVNYRVTDNVNFFGSDLSSILMPRALLNAGTLWSWGSNSIGQLGSLGATTASRSSPGTTSGGGVNWKQISAGGYADKFAGGVKTNGTLWMWGSNVDGELGIGTTLSRSSPTTTSGGGTNWSQISCGYAHTAAVKTDGTAWCWGDNSFGSVGDGTTLSRSSPVKITGTNWYRVSSGKLLTLGLKTDGSLWYWGYNGFGQGGDGTASSESVPTAVIGSFTWTDMAACNYFSIGLRSDGTLWSWGQNTNGNLGDGTTVNRSSPVSVLGGFTWKAINEGGGDTQSVLAIRTDGTLWSWGSNGNGQLGTGDGTNRSSPVTVIGGGTNWVSCTCGVHNFFAIKADGTLWACGYNISGALGNNDSGDTSSPISVVGGINTWKQVAAGYATSYGVTDISF